MNSKPPIEIKVANVEREVDLIQIAKAITEELKRKERAGNDGRTKI